MTTSFISDAATTNTALPLAKADALFDGVDAGLWGFDLASKYGYPRQSAPYSGDLLKDLQVGDGAYGDGSIVEAAGQSLGYVGKMIDFGDLTARNSYLTGPAGILAAIWGPGSGATATAALSGTDAIVTVTAGGSGYIGGEATAIFTGGGIGPASGPMTVGSASVPCTVVAGVVTGVPTPAGVTFTSAPTVTIVPTRQHYLWCAYVRLPSSADWNAETVNQNLFPLFQTADDTSSLGSQADLLTVAMHTDKSLRLLRQVFPGNNHALVLTPAAGDYGQVCQLGYWRTATGMGARLKRLASGAAEVVASTATAFTPTNANITAKMPKFGPAGAYAAGSWSAAQLAASNYKIGRGFIEALRLTGRDPLAVLDADWDRTLARGVYS